MNNEQIQALAREYGVDSVDPYGFSKDTYEDFVNEYADAAADVLRWLSKRYCLVEKSKIQEEYQKVQAHIKDGKELGIHVLVTHGASKESLLEFLFPEIAKEVEG